jgi:hypothetical protein
MRTICRIASLYRCIGKIICSGKLHSTSRMLPPVLLRHLRCSLGRCLVRATLVGVGLLGTRGRQLHRHAGGRAGRNCPRSVIRRAVFMALIVLEVAGPACSDGPGRCYLRRIRDERSDFYLGLRRLTGICGTPAR